ncbi:hypothetical protein EVAR_31570_1 [Eumeta japonica]|uniref:Uncharacterized protein n=1 Tax=Eumeta variegata TaxID=151549 RepID=A0A4C1V794_EUMVA|nr:hypothetical protein EVAR_31570_1 [Eumeta japonica]
MSIHLDRPKRRPRWHVHWRFASSRWPHQIFSAFRVKRVEIMQQAAARDWPYADWARPAAMNTRVFRPGSAAALYGTTGIKLWI